ncbi:MAG TPA: hypothetical protein VGG33_06125, partial [Polyangia bacterium]
GTGGGAGTAGSSGDAAGLEASSLDPSDVGVPVEMVTVTINRTGNGTIAGDNVACTQTACTVTVEAGSNLELEATPAAGSDFKAWSGCTTTMGTSCSLIGINASTTVTATFALSNANFVVIKDGNGSGSVTGMWTDGSLDCGNTCSAAVPVGTQITLTATPAEGSTVAWGAPCTGTGPCVVTTTAQGASAKATFTRTKVVLTIQRAGNGSVSGTGGITCAAASCPVSLDHGTSVTLQAVPAGDHDFASWTGCSTTNGNSCVVSNLKAATDVKVTFVPKKIAVTIQRNGRGRVASADGSVTCTMASCTVMVNAGSSLALDAIAEADSEFKSWSGCTSSSGGTCTLGNITAPVEVTATFALKNASFVISRQGNGKGSVQATWPGGSADCGTTCSAALLPGTVVTLTGKADAGSTLAWGAPCSGSAACMVTIAPTGTTIAATFTLNKYVLSVALAGPVGAGSVLSNTAGVTINCGATCSASVDHGTTVELVPSPAATGAFSGFTGCPGSTLTGCRLTITAATSVTGTFKWKNGAACARTTDCASGQCVNNVCCATACPTECNTQCQAGTGTCLPKPRRTSCGRVAGTAGTHTFVERFCDGAGKCVAPTIRCPAPTPVSCDLSKNNCCLRSFDNRNLTCAATACNLLPNAGDAHFGHSCTTATDCPSPGFVCCLRYIEGGGNWSSCLASCADGRVLP